MKILYGIQGTGNGHISRARDIIPELQKYGEVTILISGIQADVDLPYEVNYKMHGMSFVFGKNGGIDFWKTFISSNPFKLISDIISLPIRDYDIVISDFEPITSWAGRLRYKEVIGLSHQSAVLHPQAIERKPISLMERIGKWFLKNYAPTNHNYGFYFYAIPPSVFPAIIRKEIINATAIEGIHYTVYLPAYSDEEIIKVLSDIPDTEWQVFSKHSSQDYATKNIMIRKIDNDTFIRSMASSRGVLMGAGFEGPCEALYLRKKLMVIPMKNQYEQQCNAAGLAYLGVEVIPELSLEYSEKIKLWCKSEYRHDVDFPTDTTQKVIAQLIKDFQKNSKNK